MDKYFVSCPTLLILIGGGRGGGCHLYWLNIPRGDMALKTCEITVVFLKVCHICISE